MRKKSTINQVADRSGGWRAFALTFQVVVAISLLWEATLAVPLGWWRYQPARMTGLVIEAWHGLPLEAVLLWLAVTFTTVIIYEAVKVWQASGGKMPAFVPRRVRASIRKLYQLPDGIAPPPTEL